MTWHNIGNGNTSLASEINDNFEHIVSYNYTPLAGVSMAATTGAHNLGSRAYRWNDLYAATNIRIDDALYMTGSSIIRLNNLAYRGFNGGNLSQKQSRYAIYSNFVSTSMVATVSGYQTVTVNTGLPTEKTQTSFRIFDIRAFRRSNVGVNVYTALDIKTIKHTSTNANIHIAFDMSTETSAAIQTAFVYYEYGPRTN